MIRRAFTLLLCAAGVLVIGGAAAAKGEDASAPPLAPKTMSVKPPALDDVEHMCALLVGCERLPLPAGQVPTDLPSCVRAMYSDLASASAVSFSLTLRECGLSASSCGELRSCALRGASPDACAGRGKDGPVDLCDSAGRAVSCANERVTLVRDCPRGGEQCVVQDGKSFCALGACATETARACSASGTRILECKKGKLVSLDCDAFGLRCDDGGEGPRCATTATPSCDPFGTRCAGGVAVSCFRGHEVRVDCVAGGLGCGGAGEKVGACTSPPVDAGGCGPARCDGTTLKWCAWGTPRAYACRALGFARCVSDEKGPRCAP